MTNEADIKDILYLYYIGKSHSEIAEKNGVSVDYVFKVIQNAKEINLNYNLINHMPGDSVKQFLCSFDDEKTLRIDDEYLYPDYNDLIQKICWENHQISEIYEVYEREAHRNKKKPYSKFKFYKIFHDIKVRFESIHDFNGILPADYMLVFPFEERVVLSISEGETDVCLNVAILAYSGCIYTEAAHKLDQDGWIEFMGRALKYFEGSPDYLASDRFIKYSDSFGDEPYVLNSKLLSFANHYGFTVFPESQIISKDMIRIKAEAGDFCKCLSEDLKDNTFKTLSDVNFFIESRLYGFNNNHLTQNGLSRRILYSHEKMVLRPLPLTKYEPQEWLELRAPSSGLIKFDYDEYPFPSRYKGKIIFVKITPRLLEVYCEGVLIVSHERPPEREYFAAPPVGRAAP
jgi:hypothetical protein